MSVYAFTVILAGVTEMTEDLAEDLFVAGCDDGSPCSSEGVAAVGFDREADSLVQAIRSAVADVQKAGCRVARVMIEPEDLRIGEASGLGSRR